MGKIDDAFAGVTIKGNLDLYSKVRKPPQEALKKITGGRMKDKTDINPMWRIKTLTEEFGPVGLGWYYKILNKWLEKGGDKGEVSAFVDIELYVKYGSEWSAPIEGTGGAAYVSKESSGLYVDDDCYKKALTDALSVACKALGIAADVYWDADKTKYSQRVESPPEPNKAPVIETPEQPPEKQEELLKDWQIEKLKKLDIELLKGVIKGMGYQKAKEIPAAKYDELIKAYNIAKKALPVFLQQEDDIDGQETT